LQTMLVSNTDILVLSTSQRLVHRASGIAILVPSKPALGSVDLNRADDGGLV